MARPAKSAALNKKHLTADERSARLAGEKKLKGAGGRPKPPKHLSAEQRKIFSAVVKQLSEADILCALDSAILAQYAIAKDMLRQMDEEISRDSSLLGSAQYMSSRKQYMSDFFRCTNELCLSPQSRAKMANMAAQAQAADPLLEALRSSPDEDTEERADSFDSVEADLTVEIIDEYSGDDDE